MHFKKISIEFDGEWILRHRLSKKLPINTFIDLINDRFNGETEVLYTSFTDCEVAVKVPNISKEDIAYAVEKILSENFDIENDEIINLSIGDFFEDSIEKEESIIEKKKPIIVESKNAIRPMALDKIEDLIGADDFKVLIREIVTIAPGIIRHNTFEAFAFQNYLFSINDGCGFTTYLNLFAELLEELKLFKFRNRQKVVEVKLPPQGNDRVDPFAGVMNCFQSHTNNKGMLISIDISEWMTKITEKQFRDFLLYLEDYTNDNVIIFRIPFVEKDVLNDINTALQDILFVREVSFPPLGMEELTECAERFLTKMGFTANNDVWDVFHARVMEEKSDGRFYGINTVNKIVREMIYRKQLSDAQNDRDNSIIRKEDILSLSQSYSNNSVNGMDLLDDMIGMEQIKHSVEEIIAHIKFSRRIPNISYPCIHMRFVGSPGTGKTTVARIIGKILKENGVLRNGNFFEYSGRDFCGRYVGETAPKTAEMCRDAYGSVLFIDEAYSLYRNENNTNDFGQEALDTLISEMENHRDDFVVIMAGYTDEMNELMKGNNGLASRMPYVIEFPNYTREQLCQIYFKMLGNSFEYYEDFQSAVTEYFNSISDETLSAKDFSNARFVRNLFERTCAKASMRMQLSGINKLTLTVDDFKLASTERAFQALVAKKSRITIGF